MQYTYDEWVHSAGVNKYKITESGTAYHIDTPDDLVEILERLREQKTRVTLDYGDVKTGKSWGEVYDLSGTISRSFGGRFKIPILIHNRRSTGGGSILTDCILSIKHANKQEGGELYRLKVSQ